MSGRDPNCMFHLGFFAQQPKQWLHLRGQISFHVRGLKAGEEGGQRGQIATQQQQNTTSVDISI